MSADGGTISNDPRGRSAGKFWEMPGAGWREILVRTWFELNEDNLSLLAAGVAFYSFLAFVPLLAAIVLLYGIFADPMAVARHIHVLMRVLPSDAARIIANQLRALTDAPASKTTIGLLFAIVLALYGAMRGATSIISALNIIYGERETRGFMRTTGLSFAFTFGVVMTAILASAAIGAMSVVGKTIHLPDAAGWLVTAGLWIANAVVASGLISVLYRYGPDREDAQWSWLAPGSVFASVGALVATFLFGFYVSHFGAYNATYGALGAVVSFLMWLYVTAFVVLLGAELNAELEHQTSTDTTSGAPLPQGARGARMADTTAGVTPTATDTDPPTKTSKAQDECSGPSVMVAAVLAGQLTRRISDKPVGTIPLALLSAGTAMVLRRGDAKKALICLGAGAFLVWRSGATKADGTRAVEQPRVTMF